MDWITEALKFIVQTLLQELVVVVFGVLVAHALHSWWIERRYGGWHVILMQGKQQILNRSISAPKARDILREDADLSVFLKGVISPYDVLQIDILEEGRKKGLLVEDPDAKKFIIQLDNNRRGDRPPPSSAPMD